VLAKVLSCAVVGLDGELVDVEVDISRSQLPSTIVDAVRLGAVDYVVKPDDPDGLGEAALEATPPPALPPVLDEASALDRLVRLATLEARPSLRATIAQAASIGR